MSSTSPSVDRLIRLLEKHLIPLWENVGLEHLVVGAATQEEFLMQPMPKQMRVSAKQSTPPTNRVTKAQNTSGATLLFVAEGQADLDLGDYLLHCPQGHFVLLHPEILGQRQITSLLDNVLFATKNCRVAWFTLLPGTNNIVLGLNESGEVVSKTNDKNFCLISNPETVEFFLFWCYADYRKDIFIIPLAPLPQLLFRNYPHPLKQHGIISKNISALI